MTLERKANGQFEKGVSGNPSGRPKKAREERYKEILCGAVTFTQWRKIIKKLATKAERGDIQAARILLEYLVGKPAQGVNLAGYDGGELALTVRYVNDWRGSPSDAPPGAEDSTD